MPEPSFRYAQSCDTLVIFTGTPGRRRALFAKNSDRPGLESQPLTHAPAAAHAPGSVVPCQYLTIPQAPRTLAVLGSRPWWLWGFEHGVNEAGVAIGNEAVHTRDPVPGTGLLGMDLVRLGLERGTTAAEAKRVITGLLERYGQGGSSIVDGDHRYHNSFIVADHDEAWVIETSGRHWVARRTTEGATISNLITLTDDWDECSPGLDEHARNNGYRTGPSSARLNFRNAFEDPRYRAVAEERYAVGCRLLATATDPDVPALMRYLRDHGHSETVNTPPPGGEPARTVCLHPSGLSQQTTAASMVVELTGDDRPPVAWTSMATPCTGVFIPIEVGRPLPHELTTGNGRPSRDSAWWSMRELQHAADRDAALLSPIVQAAWAPLERRLLAHDPRLPPEALTRLLAEIRQQRDDLIFSLTAAQLENDPRPRTAGVRS